MNPVRMFFFDVDGTLLDNRRHHISEATLTSLRRLKERGGKLVVSSGRDVNTILKMPQLAAIAWDGYICRNGSVVADGQRRELFRTFFDASTMQRLEAISQQRQSPIQYMGLTDWLNLPPDGDFLKACAFFHRDPYEMPVRPTLKEDRATMALAFDHGDSDYAQFREIETLTVLPTPFHYADLVSRGIDKSVGMARLCEAEGISPAETMAFGDGINDLEMLQFAGIGVAMGQCRDEVKAVADYVTASVDEDGITHALNHFGLL